MYGNRGFSFGYGQPNPAFGSPRHMQPMTPPPQQPPGTPQIGGPLPPYQPPGTPQIGGELPPDMPGAGGYMSQYQMPRWMQRRQFPAQFNPSIWSQQIPQFVNNAYQSVMSGNGIRGLLG